MSWPGIEPGPPAWEASTLEKSHPDSLLMAIGTSSYEPATTWYNCRSMWRIGGLRARPGQPSTLRKNLNLV
jgi:hypothetical protein